MLEELKYRYLYNVKVYFSVLYIDGLGIIHLCCFTLCRYEREVNYGHRSAIKRILEGDASPASLVVLCISAIYSSCISVNENHNQMALNGAETSRSPRIELTDGW